MKLNFKPIVLTIAALATSVSGVSFAQNDKDTRADEALRREIRPLQHAPRRPDRVDGPRRDDPRYDRRGPGAGPDHNFYRGGRLPPQWRGHEYVVDDWRGHRLQAPPRGYHWVQTGADYVLVAIATGVIASIILNH